MALYAFDGTWNKEHDAGEYDRDTNVRRFFRAYEGDRHFYRGIGARHGWVGKMIGGAFGVGGTARIRMALADVSAQRAKGDTQIDIVGFSRGAALALHFSNVLERRGLGPVRFLGLWDLVAAFGIPVNLGIPFQRINLGYRLKLGRGVQHCFHALALDELRHHMRPTRINGAYEVWFRGNHADVGGGNENEKLSAIPLRWMYQKAIGAGLPIPSTACDELESSGDATAPLREPFSVIRGSPRKVDWSKDRIHYTVTPRRDQRCIDPPEDCLRETA